MSPSGRARLSARQKVVPAEERQQLFFRSLPERTQLSRDPEKKKRGGGVLASLTGGGEGRRNYRSSKRDRALPVGGWDGDETKRMPRRVNRAPHPREKGKATWEGKIYPEKG